MTIDLFDPAVQQDWYPAYQRLRDEHPVFQIPGTSIFVISRYDDVLHVLRHQDIFPMGTGGRMRPAADAVWRRHGRERMTPLGTNPPVHRRYRALVDRYFNGAGLDQWRATIAITIDDLLAAIETRANRHSSALDRATAQPAPTRAHPAPTRARPGTVEYVAEFAMPLPVRLITHILGFPAADIDRLNVWSEAWVLPFSGRLTEDQEVWVAEQTMQFHDYIADHIAAKRAKRDDSVLGELVHAQYGDERPLTDAEITGIIDHLYIGGNETTTFALASTAWILLREPGLYERVLADRSLVPQLVEECLRLESPTQGLYRTVAADTKMHGVAIPAGATVHIRFAAANRDERMFACPSQVDLDRPNSRRHTAFSLGEHSCPGSGLSRLEQTMALNAVLDRLPNLRLSPGRNDFTHHPGFVLRALNHLRLDFDVTGPDQ